MSGEGHLANGGERWQLEERTHGATSAIDDELPEQSNDFAPLSELQAWAAEQMRRPHDFTIGPKSDPYLKRWWIVPKNALCNVYLHEILRSDDDRALHDHPWGSTSMLLAGSYVEHTPEGPFVRRAGDVVSRSADALHRLEVMPEERCISLFITGPKEREWGFACPQGWVHWRDFTAADNKGQIGRGCGEQDDLAPTRPPMAMILPKSREVVSPERLDECSDVVAHLARRIVGMREVAANRPALIDMMRDRERQTLIEIEEIAGGMHRAERTIEGRRARYNENVPA